jgi:hypothetical protein
MKNSPTQALAIWLQALPGALLPLLLTACASPQPAQPALGQPPQPVPASRMAAPLPAPTALESQLGIQITHIGLTASGGLVDLRLVVLDAAKARVLLANPANTPMLLAADLPALMAPHKALHGARYGQGQVVYLLYPNLRAAVKPGAEVVVAVGAARLGPLRAQ